MTKYKVAWDNGASACGEFAEVHDTWSEADAAGRDWANESNIRDFGTIDPDVDCYTYDVVEVDVPSDEEKESADGPDWERMRRECRP